MTIIATLYQRWRHSITSMVHFVHRSMYALLTKNIFGIEYIQPFDVVFETIFV